jgi:hypothetical protein
LSRSYIAQQIVTALASVAVPVAAPPEGAHGVAAFAVPE